MSRPVCFAPSLLRSSSSFVLCTKNITSRTERWHASIKPAKKDGNGLHRKNMAGWCRVQIHHDWHWMCRFGMRWVCELGDSSTCLCEIEFLTKLCTDNFLWGFDVSFRTHDREILTSLASVRGTKRPSLFNPFGVLRNPCFTIQLRSHVSQKLSPLGMVCHPSHQIT